MQKLCGRVHEDHPDQNHQQHHESAHELFHAVAQIFAMRFRKTATIITERNHAGEVVVDRTTEDATEDNPEIGGRAELRPHDSAADRTHACDIQKLNQEKLPRLHRNVIDPVGHCLRGRFTVFINSEYPFHETAVEEVSEDK